MITEETLDRIYDKLTSDETFCRLLYYGENPLGEDKEDISQIPNYKTTIMEDLIRFSAQIEDLEQNEFVRMCVYKQFSKLKSGTIAVRKEAIQIDLYIPHRLVRLDKRMYKLESKISSIIDRLPVGLGYLDYVEGYVVPMPPIIGYALYKMTFEMEEGRSTYARY